MPQPASQSAPQPTPVQAQPCPLCAGAGGRVVFQDAHVRVVHVDEDPALPAFYRVIWQRHVREWSDLDEGAQIHCMRILTALERAMRATIAPDKINLASLGNMVPHLHWHVIARYTWDAYYPAPIWAAPHTRTEDAPTERLQGLQWLKDQRPQLEERMRSACAEVPALLE